MTDTDLIGYPPTGDCAALPALLRVVGRPCVR